LTSCHIAAEQPTAQSRDLGLEVFVLIAAISSPTPKIVIIRVRLVSRRHAFDRPRTLLDPIQKADEKHRSFPLPNSQRGETPGVFRMRRITREGKDNTMPYSVHDEPDLRARSAMDFGSAPLLG
jgi:hypothetical protein